MPLSLAHIYILCPICHTRTLDQIDQDSGDCSLIEIQFQCRRCETTCTAFYDVYRVSEVTYGQPLGPVFLTDDAEAALRAWGADEAQWIRTNGLQMAVGYEPCIYADGRGNAEGWQDTSPEEIETMLDRS